METSILGVVIGGIIALAGQALAGVIQYKLENKRHSQSLERERARIIDEKRIGAWTGLLGQLSSFERYIRYVGQDPIALAYRMPDTFYRQANPARLEDAERKRSELESKLDELARAFADDSLSFGKEAMLAWQRFDGAFARLRTRVTQNTSETNALDTIPLMVDKLRADTNICAEAAFEGAGVSLPTLQELESARSEGQAYANGIADLPRTQSESSEV